MSVEDKNGGPAFPFVEHYWNAQAKTFILQATKGMSVLDVFAAQAMKEIIREGKTPDNHHGGWAYVATHSYDIAEAMLAEKRKRERRAKA